MNCSCGGLKSANCKSKTQSCNWKCNWCRISRPDSRGVVVTSSGLTSPRLAGANSPELPDEVAVAQARHAVSAAFSSQGELAATVQGFIPRDSQSELAATIF